MRFCNSVKAEAQLQKLEARNRFEAQNFGTLLPAEKLSTPLFQQLQSASEKAAKVHAQRHVQISKAAALKNAAVDLSGKRVFIHPDLPQHHKDLICQALARIGSSHVVRSSLEADVFVVQNVLQPGQTLNLTHLEHFLFTQAFHMSIQPIS